MKLCEVCGSPEHPSWKAHVFKATQASEEPVRTGTSKDAPTRRSAPVVVKANGETPLDQPVIPVAAKAVGVDRPERRPTPKVSGWPSRESYNAYQREYMRKRRAKPAA